MIGSSRSYAIGMAHFQLAGGYRALLVSCGSFLALFLGGLALFSYSEMSTPAPVRTGLTWAVITLLTIFEVAVLVLLGCARISACIRLDMSSRMIESHRLMPIPSWRALAGYMFGGGSHALGFAALSVVLVACMSFVVGTPIVEVLFKQVYLLSFVMLLWSMAALATLMARYAFAIVMVVMLLGGFMAIAGAYVMVPAVSLLASPMFNESIFQFNARPKAFSWAYPCSLVAQAAFFGCFYAGACRRYRGTHVLTFPVPLALLVLAIWSATSIAGGALWNDFIFQAVAFEFRDARFDVIHLIAALLVTMLIALVPLHAAVEERAAGKSQLRAVVASILTALLIAAAALGNITARIPFWHWKLLMLTFLAAAAYVLGAYACLTIARRFRPLFRVVFIGLVGLLLWIGPLVLELIRAIAMSNARAHDYPFGLFGVYSPIGMLINIWRREDQFGVLYMVKQGLVGQFIIGIMLAAIAMAVQSRRARASSAPATPALPPAVPVAPAPAPNP